LNCVWFYAGGLKIYKSTLSELAEKRKTAISTSKELEFSFSTYQNNKEDMRALMRICPQKKIKIRSFMLDLEDE
jgi:hypothetical protein